MSKNTPKLEMMDVNKIIPYEKNAKIHTESQIQALAKVIQTQGWDVPIVVDKDGVIIKGHGRRLAALHLGLTEVPVIVRRDLTDAQVKAARLSDNRVAMGDFDVDAIKDELAALKSDGFDLTNMGFDEKEVTMMLGDLDSIDFAAFEGDTQSAPNASESASPTDSDATAQNTPEAATARPIALTDALGFKHVPAEYKDDLVEFQAHAESTGKQGAEAFCELIRSLLREMGEAPGDED